MKPKPKRDTAADVVKAAMEWRKADKDFMTQHGAFHYFLARDELRRACDNHAKARKP